MYEIIIHAHEVAAEAIGAFLESRGIPYGVGTEPEREAVKVFFYLEEKVWRGLKGLMWEKLQEIGSIFRIPHPVIEESPLQEDWKVAWKRYARTYRIRDALVIKPSWRSFRKSPACPVISIDPQMAFGTGGHPSTRLCLYYLVDIAETCPLRMEKVLDVGTGSGVLAIAAAKLGARCIHAIDVDSDAVKTAKENIRRNGVEANIVLERKELREVQDRFPLILANLEESVLLSLLPEFSRRVASDGWLIVSGLVSRQGRTFVARAREEGWRKVSHRHSGVWVSYCLERGRE